VSRWVTSFIKRTGALPGTKNVCPTILRKMWVTHVHNEGTLEEQHGLALKMAHYPSFFN
jgi:hypothetical protein